MTRIASSLAALTLVACGGGADPLPVSNGRGPAPYDPDVPYAPAVSASALSATVTNPLFPLPVGGTWVYEADTPDGLERDEVTVLAETRTVWGATTRVVRDAVSVDGELAEDTLDWYAQDASGHVWYMGEETAEYENGEVVTTAGSWETGVGGALPGVIMLAQPAVGDVYRQEYLADEAEDVGEIIELGLSITVPAGSFTGCMKTRDRSAIDPDLDEFKYYCPGVGNVLVEEPDARVELISYTGLAD